MTKEQERDSVSFSDGKPKNLPWFYFPMVIGLIALMIFLYASLN